MIGAVSAERLLPLFGVGILLSRVEERTRPWIVLLFGLGILLGIGQRENYYRMLAPIPGAAAHAFLTGPIACVLAGLMLVLPERQRPWAVLLLITPTGAAAGIGIVLADPTLHSRFYQPLAMIAVTWVVLGTGLVARMLDGAWLAIGSRVLGSWLMAIGLLFGGAQVASRQSDLAPPEFSVAPVGGDYPGFAGWVDGPAGRGLP